MRRGFFYARRALAALLVILGLSFVAGLIYLALTDPLGAAVLLALLAVLGGFMFLIWILVRAFGGMVRFVAGPSRRATPQGLDADMRRW